MLVKPAAVAASLLAASANAFLVPPQLSEVANGPVPVPLIQSETKDVKVNCPGCPVVINGRRAPKFMEEKPHHLDLAFSIDHQPDAADRLLVNGFELYPNPDPLHEVLSATPLLDSPPWAGKGKGKGRGPPWGKGKWGHHEDGGKLGHHRGPGGPFGRMRPEPQPLGFALHTGTVAQEADSELELIVVDFKIIEVGSEFIEGIPELHVKLIKDAATGRLMIGNVESEVPLPAPTEDEKCTTRLCKWMTSIFGSKKPCHGQRPDGPMLDGPMAHGGHHGGSGPVEPSRHMDNIPERSWRRLFKNIASHILLPVLIGIVAGVSVSLIGMAVGTLIVSAWRTFVRRPSHHHHHRRHHSRKSVQLETAIVEEKDALIDNVEPEDEPPAYEDETVKKADNQV